MLICLFSLYILISEGINLIKKEDTMEFFDKLMIIAFAFMSGGSAAATYIGISEYSKYEIPHFITVMMFGGALTSLLLLVSIHLINKKKEVTL